MPSAPHHTPLRRTSQGSLFALSRSGAFQGAQHNLSILETPMIDLVDETDTLVANARGLKHLSDVLNTFNESFASFLYVMDMHGLTTDWPQVPTSASFELAQRRAALQSKLRDLEAANRTTLVEGTEPETTYNAGATTSHISGDTSTKTAPKKKGTKPKLTAKEKKERNILMEKTISSLPLEFRGSDPNLRRNMESVIESLINSTNGAKLTDMIKPPDLSQARVNKCLVALVNRKIVMKESSTGVVLYHWRMV